MISDEEIFLEELDEIIKDYRDFLLTRGEACFKLLRLIEFLGVEKVFHNIPEELQEEVVNWAKSAPLTDKEWQSQRVFEFHNGLGGMLEAIAVKMTEQEIKARKVVVESIRKYLSENRV